jgi:Sulphur transport
VLLATAAVFAMGFAIQRGGTCTVAAIDEILQQHKARRLGAMLEASLWVAGGLVLAQLAGLAGSMPAGVAIDRWVIGGAALLGVGAWVNRACVFGAIARLGSGEWAYALSPLGFFAGALSVPWFGRTPVVALPPSVALAGSAVFLAPLFVLYALLRIARLRQSIWAAHQATIIIGIAFVISLLAAGRWAYTDVLADLAKGMPGGLGLPLLLFAALFGGALWGGWTAGRWSPSRPSVAQALRCFAGGVLMGWGSLLIPGSNDGLILIGLPLLQPHAWLAFATMCLSIALALRLGAYLQR